MEEQENLRLAMHDLLNVQSVFGAVRRNYFENLAMHSGQKES
ncbi:MAG: hypothetical protein PUD50_05390 [Eubacteriales bacterium]|nr:hypothetical protein [Eubacteriales bacterium]